MDGFSQIHGFWLATCKNMNILFYFLISTTATFLLNKTKPEMHLLIQKYNKFHVCTCVFVVVVSTWRTVNRCVVRRRKSVRTYCACQFAQGTITAEFLNQLLNSLTLLNSLKTAGELEYQWLNFATVKEFSPFPNCYGMHFSLR